MSFRFPSLGAHDSPGSHRRTLEHFAKVPDRGNVTVFLYPGCDLLAKVVVFGKGESAHRNNYFLMTTVKGRRWLLALLPAGVSKHLFRYYDKRKGESSLQVYKHDKQPRQVCNKRHKKQTDRVKGGNPVGLSSQFTGCCRESQVDFDFLFEHSLASLFG